MCLPCFVNHRTPRQRSSWIFLENTSLCTVNHSHLLKISQRFHIFWGNLMPLWVLENLSEELFYGACRLLLFFPWDSPGRSCPRCHVWGSSEKRVMHTRREMVARQQPFKQERLCCLRPLGVLSQPPTKTLSQFVGCKMAGIVACESSANVKPIIRLRKAGF